MSLRNPTARFAVIGQPIDHSLSPFIHRLFAKQWSVDLDYQAIAVAPEDLPAKLDGFAANGGGCTSSGRPNTLPRANFS